MRKFYRNEDFAPDRCSRQQLVPTRGEPRRLTRKRAGVRRATQRARVSLTTGLSAKQSRTRLVVSLTGRDEGPVPLDYLRHRKDVGKRITTAGATMWISLWHDSQESVQRLIVRHDGR